MPRYQSPDTVASPPHVRSSVRHKSLSTQIPSIPSVQLAASLPSTSDALVQYARIPDVGLGLALGLSAYSSRTPGLREMVHGPLCTPAALDVDVKAGFWTSAQLDTGKTANRAFTAGVGVDGGKHAARSTRWLRGVGRPQ